MEYTSKALDLNKSEINYPLRIGVEDKSVFPFKLLNDNNRYLDYVGKVPPIKYFYNISTVPP